jgi:hypothetical protein
VIKVFKNFINYKDQQKINETILSPRWLWGHRSNPIMSHNDSEFFWQIPYLIKEEF